MTYMFVLTVLRGEFNNIRVKPLLRKLSKQLNSVGEHFVVLVTLRIVFLIHDKPYKIDAHHYVCQNEILFSRQKCMFIGN